MKLIKSSYKIIPQEAGLEGIYKAIERAGRTCYKSEDKITDTSAKEFVDRMIKSGHCSMLEHGTVYLGRPVFPDIGLNGGYSYETDGFYKKYIDNKFSHVEVRPFKWSGEDGCYVTTNLRVLVENNWLDDLQYICEPTEFHERRITVHFVCDRGVSHEFVRHRVMSFAQESTRYCNYSNKDKFGNELTFIIPCWIKDLEEKSYLAHAEYHHAKEDASKQWYDVCMNSEFVYEDLIRLGWKPQQARAVLPNSLKTELVMTGFISDWQHFFGLRCDKAAHPQARELAIPLQEEFIKRGYIN